MKLKKDLSVADLAKMLETPPREVMELNPKLKGPTAAFPAADNGRPILHSISAPKDKGNKLLNVLRKEGYIVGNGKYTIHGSKIWRLVLRLTRRND